MEGTERKRLMDEAKMLIEQSELSAEEKDNLTRNIESFLSMISRDSIVKDCKWSWFDETECEGRGLDLTWDWKDMHGVFGFYTDNGHGFSFDFGENGWSGCLFGGEDGEHGFSCGIFVDDFENTLTHMGY